MKSSSCNAGLSRRVIISQLVAISRQRIFRGRSVFSVIPGDAIEFVRDVFAAANIRVTTLLARQPAMHEEGLDFQLIAALNEIGPRRMPGSGVGIEIESHWLGGRRLFRRWEIADIALVIIVRQVGTLVSRKVALLKSKRLYSREIRVHELDRADYIIGIGRLIDRTEPVTSLTAPRSFGFSERCIYGAMAAGSEQIGHIDDYMKRSNLPVYYSLYNPPRLPFKGVVPRLATRGGRHNALGRVGAGHRIIEEHHDPITRELINLPNQAK
jgi:hypothetical protein